MKKVLVITYYWPPSGGSGVQRWLKFCKYLRDFGWEPIVYTPENPDVDLVDESLAADVHPAQVVVQLPIREPRRMYNSLTRASKSGAQSDVAADQILYLDPSERTRKQTALVWARSNLLIPDARALWIKPSVEFLTEYLKFDPVDAIVSTGPPHSMHVIARDVKRNVDVPWIADFRDPWTDIVYYDRLPLTRWADQKHRDMEQSVIHEADILVQVAPSWAARLGRSGGKRVETITNGYDADEMPKTGLLATDKFRINHSGVLTADRNHEAFWEALRAATKGIVGFGSSLEIELVGKVDPSVITMANRYGFSGMIVQAGYRPHSETLARMADAHVLLLPINRTSHGAGFIPGKMFEYMASGRPILMIGPPGGDAAKIIEETRTGVVISYDDFHSIKTVVSDWFKLSKTGSLHHDPTGVEAYSRRNLTERMAALLNEVVGVRATPPGDT